jgi:intracellular septation protein
MQLLLDFLPVFAFFAAYKLAGIYVATAVIIVATLLQVGIHWVRTRKVNPMHLLSAGLVLVFGGITLLIHDKTYIMWKPTILNWLFAAAFLASQLPLFGGRPFVQRLMDMGDSGLRLPQPLWHRLNLMWVVFFAVMGGANLYVFKHYDEPTWVNFKLFGMLGLTIVFIVVQGFWLASKAETQQESGS